MLQQKRDIKNRQACKCKRENGIGEKKALDGRCPVLYVVCKVEEMEARTGYCREGMLSSWRRRGCAPNPLLDNIYSFLRRLPRDPKSAKASRSASADL